jgi:2'-5' RNA ligase
MNIELRRKLRILLEEKGVSYEYGCVMLYVEIPRKEWKSVLDLIDRDDLYMGENGKEENKYALEKTPHITLLYGIHSDVPDKEVEVVIDTFSSFGVSIGNISKFESPECDVLKFDMHGDGLKSANKKLSELPHTNEHSYHPHMTVAYVKKGKADKYIKLMNEEDIKLDIKSDEIVYSKADGTEKHYNINN